MRLFDKKIYIYENIMLFVKLNYDFLPLLKTLLYIHIIIYKKYIQINTFSSIYTLSIFQINIL